MANVIYEDRMFNEEIKRKFMIQYNEGSQKVIHRLFKIAASIEYKLNQDLYSFNEKQLIHYFSLLMPSTEHSSKNNVRWIDLYIRWSIAMGYWKESNPLDEVSTEWKEQFTHRRNKTLWTEDEMVSIISRCVNAQDAVIVSLIFNGIYGKQYSEILNLTKSDIDAENSQLHVVDDAGNESRIVTVSESCILLCGKALHETCYEKKNGKAVNSKAPTAQLTESDYVVRPAITQTKNMDRADKHTVHRRIAMLGEDIGEMDFIPRNIAYSGMLAMLHKFYLQEGEITKKAYLSILKQFGISGKAGENQTLFRLRHGFLNEEKMKEMYPKS
ncbi:integrase [Paenibacillus sp. SYP-B3998]|uniref:Integrase n=1 Tax=Paenibacillus sp. SYP-B3998 TaxID=2678564 RepID=A0A6G3ZRC3_9BACL|nr:site-specific integrase [Paenibacillus sp. SYP-B3998]NEW04682.1 integrase [Paenibacillus sp. SYP-B3998]